MKKVALTPRFCDKKYEKDGVNHAYIEAISKSGATPYMLCLSLKSVADYAKDMDGLLITGGEDINPKLYSQDDVKSHRLSDEYDNFEIELIKAFHKLNKPIFGICRGLQIINVAFKGTLYQDIDKDYQDLKRRHLHNYHKGKLSHRVKIAEDSFLDHIYHKKEMMVNSYHHQAVKDLGEGLKVSAYSDDGLIEAFEAEKIIAVQWHPEKIFEYQKELFTYFINML